MENSTSMDSVNGDDLAVQQNDQIADITKKQPPTRKRRCPANFDAPSGSENSTNVTGEVSMMTIGSKASKPRLPPGPPMVTSQSLSPTLRRFSAVACVVPVIAAFLTLGGDVPEISPATPEEAPLQPTLQFDLLSQSPHWSSALAAGIEQHAREWENKYRVRPEYLTHARGFTAHHRAEMVNAMLNFTRGRNWTLQTVHLAVSLLDRYLSATLWAPAPVPAQQPARTGKSGAPLRARAKKAPAPKPTGPRLSDAAHRTVLTATMLWMAYKLEEKQVGFNFAWLRDLARELSSPAPSKEAVVRCESAVVEALDYHLTAPTAQVYLTMLASVADLDVDTFSLAKCLGERCLLEYSLLRFLPSELACAAMYVARTHQMNEATGPALGAVWTPQLQSFTGLAPAEIRPCAEAVLAVLRRETYSRARLHGHAILAGTDYSQETLLRTLQDLAGNNTRSGGWVLQPFSPAFPSGRISERLQAYHDAFPCIMMSMRDDLLQEVQPRPLEDHFDNMTAASMTSMTTTATNTVTTAPPSVSQSTSTATPSALPFRIFGSDVLSSVATAPRASQHDSFVPLSQLSQLTAEESMPFGACAFEPLRLGGTSEFATLSRMSASDSFPWLPDGLSNLSRSASLPTVVHEFGLSVAPATVTRHAASNTSVSSATTAAATSQSSAMMTAPRPFASLRLIDSSSSDAFPVVATQDTPAAQGSRSVHPPTVAPSLLTPRSAAPVVSQPPPLSSAAPAPREPVLCFTLPPEVQGKYELYPDTHGEPLLTLALRRVDGIQPVYDAVLLRYRQHYRRLVACPPSF